MFHYFNYFYYPLFKILIPSFMQRSFLIVVVLLLSIASAEIIPSKIVIQPLTINPIITVKPAPSIQIPTIPIKPTIPVSLPTEDSPCGIKGFCG